MASRFTLRRAAVREILHLPETRALTERKTRAAADAATAAARSDGWRGEFRVDVEMGDKRPRGAVIGDYSTPYPEVSRRALLRALDAARGQD